MSCISWLCNASGGLRTGSSSRRSVPPQQQASPKRSMCERTQDQSLILWISPLLPKDLQPTAPRQIRLVPGGVLRKQLCDRGAPGDGTNGLCCPHFFPAPLSTGSLLSQGRCVIPLRILYLQFLRGNIGRGAPGSEKRVSLGGDEDLLFVSPFPAFSH